MTRFSGLAFGGDDSGRSAWRPAISILAGSLVTALLPVVATVPILPPFGLLMLLGWRLHRPDAFPPWAAVLLGLFDDLVSGQPLGSAMALWTVCILALDVIDNRLVWRDFWQNWLIAAGAIGSCLIITRLIATPIGAHVDTALLIQIVTTVALYPVVARLCASLDRDRRRR